MQDFGEPYLQLIKWSSEGLRGNDFKEFVKRAGKLASIVQKLHVYPGEELVHDIALGAGEYYGANRNGDFWGEDDLRRCHGTFVKHARAYRFHCNKDTEKSYGIVKASHYNEDAHRVDLILALNGSKEAALRNGGLTADEELELLHSGKMYSTSMAAKIAADICRGCSNRARTRDEYCLGEDEGGHCKRGGVKNRMCFTHDDGFINGVDNPDPLFFDISRVPRGACRTSHAMGLIP